MCKNKRHDSTEQLPASDELYMVIVMWSGMQAWTWIGYCRDVGPCMHSDQHGAVILMTTGRASHRHSQIVPVVFGRSQHLASQRVPPTSHVPSVSTSQALPRIPGILPVGYPIDDPGKAGTVLGRERLFSECEGGFAKAYGWAVQYP